MVDAIVRIGFVIFGVLMFSDVFLPKATLYTKITDHTISTASRGRGDRYTLHFDSALNSSCSVDRTAFEKLKDGDEVVVQNTRLLKRCIKIERNGEPAYSFNDWIFLSLLIGAGFTAYGIRWFKFRRNH
ncbi:MAG: hypothetical protein EOO07_37660 [Chitinophagaceae bacterium]|nr:MAG: hypothetical protein EOO07_37660 [Chitinophagaceae bacterium]